MIFCLLCLLSGSAWAAVQVWTKPRKAGFETLMHVAPPPCLTFQFVVISHGKRDLSYLVKETQYFLLDSQNLLSVVLSYPVQLAEMAEQVGKIVEHNKAESTRPN